MRSRLRLRPDLTVHVEMAATHGQLRVTVMAFDGHDIYRGQVQMYLDGDAAQDEVIEVISNLVEIARGVGRNRV